MATTSCCPDNSWGDPLEANHATKSLVGASGELRYIGHAKDLEIYVSRPAEEAGQTQKALCVLTDVFGLQSRLFAICDKLATELQLTVVALDTFRGETKDKHLDDFKEWLGSHPFERGSNDYSAAIKDDKTPVIYPVKEDIDSCFDFLYETHNIKSSDVGAVGFCWGVWAMTKASEMNLFRCGVGFHPSIKIESVVFGGDQAAIVKRAADNAPLLMCVAGNDLDNLKPAQSGELAQIIIASSQSKHKTDYLSPAVPRCVEFPQMVHGWVSRGDTSIVKVKKDAEAALNLGVQFLRHWM